MRAAVFFVLLVLCYFKGEAQYIVGIDDIGSETIRRDKTGTYLKSATDTGFIIFYSAKYNEYRKLNAKGKAIIIGDIALIGNEKIGRHGKWTEFYSNGKAKCLQHFCYGEQIGTEEFYYPNGQVQSKATMTYIKDDFGYSCHSGLYQEYYPSGQIKLEGYYALKMNNNLVDTITMVDPVTMQESVRFQKSSRLTSYKWGTWKYYDEKGTLSKKEQFR